MIVYVKARLPLDETKLKTDLPAFTAMLRQYRQNDAFNEWFRKNAEEGLRSTAFTQLQPSEMRGAPPKR